MGLLPFLAFAAVFLFVPTGLIAVSAFLDANDGKTVLTLNNFAAALDGAYLEGLLNSFKLSAVTAIVAAVSGFALAYVVQRTNRGLREFVSTMSAVLANFGGLPLALLFIAAIGNAGSVTTVLQQSLGISLSEDLHFSLYSLTGVGVVYLYFLIPLMVLVITPALEGIRAEWQEAAESLGASTWFYLRYVAGPVLVPNILGATALLFCTALSAFATASAISNGTVAITPLQIDFAVSGDVLIGQEHLADALATVLIIIVLPLTMLYQRLQRRTSRWLQ
jgi:putative spermidine/putrescine transport system permease protein